MDEKKFAVLIDADNISPMYFKIIFDEIAREGLVTIKRIYADWTAEGMDSKKEAVLTHALTPIQQYAYTTGKNATDSAMIIDAMDILHERQIDGFCLASSDSDFTKLATRLRESGKIVIGMGEKKTPQAFSKSCNKFLYLDVLLKNQEKEQSTATPEEKETPAQSKKTQRASKKKAAEAPVKETPKPAEPPTATAEAQAVPEIGGKENLEDIRKIIVEILSSDENVDWMFAGTLREQLQKKASDFDPRNFGFKKWVRFLQSMDCFEFEERPNAKDPSDPAKSVYVRIKPEE